MKRGSVSARRLATPTQLEMWLAVQRQEESGRYNTSLDVEFEGAVDVGALRTALGDVLARHRQLCSRFEVEGGDLVQIFEPGEVCFVHRQEPGRYSREAALQRARAEGDRPLSTRSGSLLRASLTHYTDGGLLTLTVHHLVTDGWSMEVLAGHLLDAYRARCAGVLPHLPGPPRVLEDGVGGSSDPDASGVSGVAYWQELLAGAPGMLMVPGDVVRPSGGPAQGAYLEEDLPPLALERLRALGEQAMLSPAAIVLAAWHLLLSAWSGNHDGVLGVPFSGRDDDWSHEEVGLYARVLPVRMDFDPERCFRAHAARIGEQLLDGMEHQRVAIDRLRSLLSEAEDGGIYRVVFDHRIGADAQWSVRGTTIRLLDHGVEGVKYDLALASIELRDRLRLRLDYDTGIYRSGTVALLLRQLSELLASALAHPDRAGRELMVELARTAGRHAVAGTAGGEPLIGDLVLDHARRRPDAVAVRQGTTTLTYGELVARSQGLAAWLRQRGVALGSIVALLLQRGIDSVVAMLATILAGAAYLPLDPAYPDRQLELILADAEPRLLLTSDDQRDRLDPVSCPVYGVGEAMRAAATLTQLPSPSPVQGRDPINVLYTSGSTGRPKGVLLPHRGLARLMGSDRFLRLNETDVVAHLSPLNFDGASFEIWGALAHGAELVVLGKELVLSPRDLCAAVRRDSITTLIVTTPLLNRIIDDAPDLLQSLRRVYFGGERVSVSHVHRALRWCGPNTLVHSYGPTENSFTSTYHPIGEVDERAATVPIGLPVPGTQVFVVFENTLDLVPPGVVGELLLGGSGVGDGYLGDGERSAVSFVPNPFDPVDPDCPNLYRTGDRVRWNADGRLEFLSRRDSQVKIRSQRVELGEVEAALLAQDAVEDAFVSTAANPRGESEIVGYVVVNGAGRLEEIRAALRRCLPAFAVPTHLVPMDHLPLTVNGKIDRRRLPIPELPELPALPGAFPEDAGPARATQPPAPKLTGRLTAARGAGGASNGSLAAVLAAWRDVLGDRAVSAGDNFFDFGGHSLLIVKLQEAIRVRTGVSLTIAQLLEHPFARSQSDLVDGSQPALVQDLPQDLPKPRGNVRLRVAGSQCSEEDIAVVGMGCRFAGAADLGLYWRNLREGRDCMTGAIPPPAGEGSGEVRRIFRYGQMAEGPVFDGDLFGMPDDPVAVDPQHGVFYESLWAAIEDAAVPLASLQGRTSLYAGRATASRSQVAHGDSESFVPATELLFSASTFMTTWFSYQLDLGGESLLLDAGCSTSLLAVHLACESLRQGRSEYALAGGVSIQGRADGSYEYRPGQIFARDGVCRPFDRRATGVIGGDGAGAVLLRRMSDALRDNDLVYAVIKGSAANNDGRSKVGYIAPGVDGQVRVIEGALASAGVAAGQLDYVETHGTGTRLGDAIEFAALASVFGSRERALALGSVKASIGHTDTAAGIAGFIKAVLAVYHGLLPATPNVGEPIEEMQQLGNRFVLLPESRPWDSDGLRFAGVSSFGVGGTNAHVIVQQHRGAA